MASETSGVNVKEVIERADQIYHDNKLKQAYDYLSQYKETDHCDVQWRLARLCYHTGRYQTESEEETKQFAQDGLIHAERAILLDNSNYSAFQVRIGHALVCPARSPKRAIYWPCTPHPYPLPCNRVSPPVPQWMGIMIDWESEYAGYKKKIEKSYEIRDHFRVSR